MGNLNNMCKPDELETFAATFSGQNTDSKQGKFFPRDSFLFGFPFASLCQINYN